jgi:hypothetical protein
MNVGKGSHSITVNESLSTLLARTSRIAEPLQSLQQLRF